MTQQTYQERPISVNAAAKKYGIPQRTLADWAAKGRIKVLVHPEKHGQKMLVDEASIVLARQAYTPYWRQGQGRNLPLPLEIPDNPVPEVQVAQTPPPGTFTPTVAAGSPSLDTATLIDGFNHYNRRLAPSTLEGYHFRLKDFLAHFPVLPLSPEPIQDYIDDLPGTDAHRHTCATVLRTLYRWAYKHHHIPREIENPIDLVKFPPDGRKGKLPRVLTDEEAMNVINAGRTFEEKTMLKLLWGSGLRAGELRSLTQDMIYPPDKAMPQPSIRPSGKMGERKVWITDQLHHDLQVIAASKPGEYIFTDRNGNQLSSDGLYQRVAWCMKKAGIKGKKRGPYAFRHTFITNILADSKNLKLAQELAGHSQIATTLRYTHLAPKDIAQDYGKFNPEHRLEGKGSDEEKEGIA